LGLFSLINIFGKNNESFAYLIFALFCRNSLEYISFYLMVYKRKIFVLVTTNANVIDSIIFTFPTMY